MDKKVKEYTMPQFLLDPPNLCSLAGLLCSFLGVYFAIRGAFYYALAGVLWAVVFDWVDGIAAKRIKNRDEAHRAVGLQLDSLIDIVSFGVFPAVFLLSYGAFRPAFIPGAFLITGGAALRLSCFNVFGMIDKSTYRGLALDNNVLLLSLIFPLERFLPRGTFSVILYALFMVLLALNLAPVRTYKFGGRWFYALLGYVIVMTALYVFIL
jgi:CDP-diacylglycerol--serine O-phosphatidyltransferase